MREGRSVLWRRSIDTVL